MALYSSKNVCLCPLRLLARTKLQLPICSLIHQSFKEDTGVLDSFTSQLVQTKINKWERRKNLAQTKAKNTMSVPDIAKNCSKNNIKNSEIDAVNELFQKALDYADCSTVDNLVEQCIQYDKVPSLSILMQVLSLCSQKGDQDTIRKVSHLCEKVRPEVLQENSNFEHYIAEAIWVKGDIIKSLNMFQRIYKENVYLRRKIRSILRYLILDSVTSHSEATVVILLQFSDILVKQYNDYFPLGCLWQACILSEWFTDQQIALDLLDQYPDLCNVIVNKIPFVVRISLRHHRTEVVYRLTEALLRFKMESEIAQVILALLDYWIQQGDFRQCREIVLWCVENDIRGSAIVRNEKLMKLFAHDIQAKVKSEAHKPAPTTDYKF